MRRVNLPALEAYYSESDEEEAVLMAHVLYIGKQHDCCNWVIFDSLEERERYEAKPKQSILKKLANYLLKKH